MRRVLAFVVVVVAAALLLAFALTRVQHPTTPASPTTSTVASGTAPIPAATPRGRALQMLDAVILPAGAKEVRAFPKQVLTGPAQHPACQPLVDETRRWVVTGAPAAIQAFLVIHAPAWIPNQGTGSGGSIGRPPSEHDVMDAAHGPGWDAPSNPPMLVLSVASLGGGRSAIRADAQVVPAGSICARA